MSRDHENESALVVPTGRIADAMVGAVPPVSSYTLAGPAVLDIGTAGAFTVILDAPAASAFTLTPSDRGGGGAFAPATVSIVAGATTATFTYTPASAGAVTVAAINTGGLLDAPGLPYVVTSYGTYKPIYDGNTQAPAIRADYMALASPAPLASPDVQNHYDPIEVWYNLRDYTGDPTYADEIGVALYQMRDSYYLPTAGGVPGHSNYSRGLLTDWHRTGSDASRAALHLCSRNGANSNDAANWAYMTDQATSREVAYAALSLLDDEECGCAHRVRLDQGGGQQSYVNLMLGHCDQWLTPEGSRSPCWYLQPFMVGLTLRSLIAYWDRYRDSTVANFASLNAGNLAGLTTIPAVIKAVLDLLWTGGHKGPTSAARTPFWFPDQHNPGFGLTYVTYAFGPKNTGAFTYRNPYAGDQPSSCYPVGFSDGGNYPTCTLNLLISPAFHWYYQNSGDDTYRQRGDAIFAGSMASVVGIFSSGQKEYHQCYLWSTNGVAWRARGANPPPAATALTLAAPSPASGAANAPSDRFTVALAGGNVSVANPVTVTFHDSAGSRFLPPTVKLTADRPTLTARVVPPASAANSTITVWTSNDGGLANPPAVSYAVGAAAALATGYSVVPPASANGATAYSPPWTVSLVPANSVPPASADPHGGLVLINYSDHYKGGVFIPPFSWLAPGRTRATFAYYPANDGARPIDFINTAGLADPARNSIVYTPAIPGPPSPAAATTYTLTAPSPATGRAGMASAGFTVAMPANTTLAATTITPSDGCGGAFAPTSVTLGGGATTATFTYTPATAGVKTIAVANGAGLTNPAAVTYTALSLSRSYICGSASLSSPQWKRRGRKLWH